MISSISIFSLRSSASNFFTILSFYYSAFCFFCSYSFIFVFSSSDIYSTGLSIHFYLSIWTSKTEVFFSSRVPPIIWPRALWEESSSASFLNLSSSFNLSLSTFSLYSLERYLLKGISSGLTSNIESFDSNIFFLGLIVSEGLLSSSHI